MKKLLIASLFSLCAVTSCVDLDIPPKNIVNAEDLLSNESGMEIYMSRMYSHMPVEDFKYMAKWGFRFNGWLACTGVEGTGEAVTRDNISSSFTHEESTYWGDAFSLLHDANFLLENLPSFSQSYSEETYNHYLGEAYYVRATVFYAMARRFGGIPLVTRVINYPAAQDELEVPRSSEEETWNQILADFDKAIELLKPDSPKSGYANKYKALTYKSEAMLYAGCVAKYNETVTGRLTGLGKKTGVRVIGFDANTWESAAKKYFTEAYKAAREVMKSGKYSLYKKKWSADDRQAQYQNMVDMFSDLSSPENINVKEYIYPTVTHGYDAYSAPYLFRSPLSAGTCPTLDFVELFDGFERYSDGTIKVTTGNSNTEGDYLLFDRPIDFFKNAEPRLRAYVIFPGDMFKGREMEARGGIYTGAEPVKPLFKDYSYANAHQKYEHLAAYTQQPKTLYMSSKNTSQEQCEVNGVMTNACAGNGPYYSDGETNPTGFYGRKWLNPDPSFVAREGNSAQPFILMRYADVLLNAAEAAVEMSLMGVDAPDGEDMLQIATDAIRAIRERAGAEQLTQKLTADEQSRDIVRKERRKELAFEHKTKWDLRRWRVQHYDNRDGFWGEKRDKNMFSNNENYRFRGLYPFMSAKSGKYFFDAHFQWIATKTFSYNVIDYYFSIPENEVSKSTVIDQQPNR